MGKEPRFSLGDVAQPCCSMPLSPLEISSLPAYPLYQRHVDVVNHRFHLGLVKAPLVVEPPSYHRIVLGGYFLQAEVGLHIQTPPPDGLPHRLLGFVANSR